MTDVFSLLNRRGLLRLGAAACALPGVAVASPFRQITWDDLIPPGVAYGEIVGEGEMDMENDTWNPIYDDNAFRLNTGLDGKAVRLPGYILPLDISAAGVTDFILVPYVGACIHVPPPPPNQLVGVRTPSPWPADSLWDPVWVSGSLSARLQSTEIAEIGYHIEAQMIEPYEWED